MTPDQLLNEAAGLFKERAEVYGRNWERVGAVLAAMMPEGVHVRTTEDQVRMHLVHMIVAKLCRYANNMPHGGHFDSALDMAVYAAMLATATEEADHV